MEEMIKQEQERQAELKAYIQKKAEAEKAEQIRCENLKKSFV